jgi:hypothetical protein
MFNVGKVKGGWVHKKSKNVKIVMNSRRYNVHFVAGLMLGSWLAFGGCIPFGDPEGSGASGVLSMGSEVASSAEVALEIRIFPLKGDADPVTSVPQATDDCDLACTEVASKSLVLSDVAFPLNYSVSHPLGNSEFKVWRVVAWLSGTTGSSTPKTGDIVGTTTVSVASCGSFGGFCGITTGIDFALDQVLP